MLHLLAMSKRDELAEQATDYALEHGLIGLSLRPAGRRAGHERPDADLPLRLEGRPDRRGARRLVRPLGADDPRAAAVAVGAPGRARPLGGLREPSSSAASGSTSRRLRWDCSAASPTPRSVRAVERRLDGARSSPTWSVPAPASGLRRLATLVDADVQRHPARPAAGRRPASHARSSRTSPTPWPEAPDWNRNDSRTVLVDPGGKILAAQSGDSHEVRTHASEHE